MLQWKIEVAHAGAERHRNSEEAKRILTDSHHTHHHHHHQDEDTTGESGSEGIAIPFPHPEGNEIRSNNLQKSRGRLLCTPALPHPPHLLGPSDSQFSLKKSTIHLLNIATPACHEHAVTSPRVQRLGTCLWMRPHASNPMWKSY